MVKTIAVSSCGIGFGHAARDKVIYESLRKQFNVKIFSYGEGYLFLKKNGVNVAHVPGISYARGKYALDIFSEVFYKIASFRKIQKEYLSFAGALDSAKPDLVITDSEPYGFFYAHRRNIPIIIVGNVVSTLKNHAGLPKNLKSYALGLQQFMLKNYVGFMMKRGAIFVEPTIDRTHIEMQGFRQVGLVVRQKPEHTKPAKLNKRFYYVSVGSATEQELIAQLKKAIPKFKNKFFVIAANSIKKKTLRKNFTLVPFLKNPFPYIKGCSGIIAPAGHTIISEALAYKKPILAVPVSNHIEQLVNAHLVEKQGFGVACYGLQDLQNSMQAFFAKEKLFMKNVKTAGFESNGADEIVKIAKGLLNQK